MVSEDLAKIVAVYLQILPSEVSLATSIDRRSIQSSVLHHRLRAELVKAGFSPQSWDKVETVGDLLGLNSVIEQKSVARKTEKEVGNESYFEKTAVLGGIGIDIEDSESMPSSEDFFLDLFYNQNFTKKEIAFCSRADHPKRCFAGRFAVKEAIFKATGGESGNNFNAIEVVVDEGGGITNDLCDISISHLKKSSINLSVAVAIRRASSSGQKSLTNQFGDGSIEVNKRKSKSVSLVNSIGLWSLWSLVVGYILFFHVIQIFNL